MRIDNTGDFLLWLDEGGEPGHWDAVMPHFDYIAFESVKVRWDVELLSYEKVVGVVELADVVGWVGVGVLWGLRLKTNLSRRKE